MEILVWCGNIVLMGKKVPDKQRLVGEFFLFLQEYGVIGLAVAVVVGGAVSKLTKSLAEDIIMPVVEVLIPGGAWRALVLSLGPVELAIGSFLGSLIDFLIIALIVFAFYKFILKREKITKR